MLIFSPLTELTEKKPQKMSDKKDYSKLTLEELSKEEKGLKRNEIVSAVLVGFMIGVIIFGVAKNGFGFIYTVIPVVLILGIAKGSQKQKNNLKEIRSEIESKKGT